MLTARAIAGATLRSHEDGVVVTAKRPTFGIVAGETATVVIDELTDAHARGRVLLTAPDATRVAGSFDATVCSSAQHAATTNPTLAGLTWGAENVRPASLPTTAVTTLLLGKTETPVTIEAVEWQDATLGQHEIHFFANKPVKACGTDQMDPGFKVMFPSAIATGSTIDAKVTTVTRTGNAAAVVMWNEPGNVLGLEGNGYASAIVDAVTPNEIRGRVFAWFDDASKSMIAGAFTAKRCHVTP